MKLVLDNVTLFGIDCVDINRLIKAANICQKNVSFGAVKLLTSITYDHPQIIKVNHISSHLEYSKFMLKEMNSYVDTEYVLVIQHDGFILNSDAWMDDFLNYDYIGAPYSYYNRLIVGNGGFSLRSKKLTSMLANDDNICISESNEYHIHQLNGINRNSSENEDYIISKIKRFYLEQKGICFAPVNLAKRFSFEGNHISGQYWSGQFGFHSFQVTSVPSHLIN